MANTPVPAAELTRIAHYVYHTTPLVTDKGWPHLMSDDEVRMPSNITVLAWKLHHDIGTLGYACDYDTAERAIRQEAGLIAA